MWDRESVLNSQTRTFEVTIEKSNGCSFDKLSATLIWVDQGSLAGCMQYVLNDLDLHVTKTDKPDKIHFPNGLGQRDSINNAERVVIDMNITDGDTFTLHVISFNLDNPSHQFALVTTGCFGGVPNSVEIALNALYNKSRVFSDIVNWPVLLLPVFGFW